MSKDETPKPIDAPQGQNNDGGNTITRESPEEFAAQIDALLRDAEALRLRYMKQHRTRGHFAMSAGLIALTLGAAGFGWFFLMKADLLKALGSMGLAVAIPAMLHIWSAQSLKDYKQIYKAKVLPRMAKALGGFQFHPQRGISRALIAKTGLIPRHDIYKAEDCFMGRYNGVKVMFSEARLLSKKSYEPPLFDGLFVVLEVPEGIIEGHTIITAHEELYRQWRPSRWAKLQDVKIDVSEPEWDRFHIASSKPDSAKLLIGERLLKELSEASDIFDDAPLSAAMFGGKFIFLMIPYDGDMFEASDMHAPVATKQHAIQCRREINQLLEIIDVFDLYQTNKAAAPSTDDTPQG